jgi:hypothetical protein
MISSETRMSEILLSEKLKYLSLTQLRRNDSGRMVRRVNRIDNRILFSRASVVDLTVKQAA